ncbi:MAG TPA: ABC transporter ATP-binding protein [bacterium]|nr:ABC transporter ATP-binding protein [bacterium]
MPAVVADGLTRRFGLVYAVRDLSVSVPRSAVLLVMGPNGSGKTTFLRLLATALVPTAGRASIFGVDVIREPNTVRRTTAYVAAVPGFYAGLTAQENLAFAAAMSSARVEPREWLVRVGLGEVANRPVRTFSQGMKRRLALACAWLRAPTLLLLDEPFSGLDADGRRVVEALIADVKSRNGSAIICTHEWESGMALADHVITLTGGRVVESTSIVSSLYAEFAPARGQR